MASRGRAVHLQMHSSRHRSPVSMCFDNARTNARTNAPPPSHPTHATRVPGPSSRKVRPLAARITRDFLLLPVLLDREDEQTSRTPVRHSLSLVTARPSMVFTAAQGKYILILCVTCRRALGSAPSFHSPPARSLPVIDIRCTRLGHLGRCILPSIFHGCPPHLDARRLLLGASRTAAPTTASYRAPSPPSRVVQHDAPAAPRARAWKTAQSAPDASTRKSRRAAYLDAACTLPVEMARPTDVTVSTRARHDASKSTYALWRKTAEGSARVEPHQWLATRSRVLRRSAQAARSSHCAVHAMGTRTSAAGGRSLTMSLYVSPRARIPVRDAPPGVAQHVAPLRARPLTSRRRTHTSPPVTLPRHRTPAVSVIAREHAK
ncbi:hypothetical protein POSPLADRAFT_1053368 [Postia placenta MAD-698-R-SB12]|uniref:Uncharacterized protein n=1 Tax=Postia placenta MAD-698-R-SB12 TaxID=670580 RepID=A0A1X6NE24_9APHY|nr:hypothetical protein POSPLADRAFT_1053368 [Postia placenta MAD-698-R-SB12]OSX66752.1 hypothetical protein POSPLADRAFT_1053368 [Postia placenta MAD-698-R-SB12]